MVNHIKSIEYNENGLVKRVEFYPCAPQTKPLTVYTLTKTVGEKTMILRKNISLDSIFRPLP